MSEKTENGKCARTRGAHSEHESAHEPVAPSNTTGSFPQFKLLRAGIDSLYLSYEGSFHDGMREELERLKKLAQAESLFEKNQAQLQINDHIFEVMPKGKGAYPYFIQDNAFGIKTGVPEQSKFPWVSVQCQSELLAFKKPLGAERLLAGLLQGIGKVTVDPNLSRVDICVDFITDYDLSAFTSEHIICKSRKIAWYEDVEFTGFTVGLGSPMAFRLYDKTQEIKKSKKDWLLPLWEKEGWDGQARVYRAEFQIKRKVLKELDITHFSQLSSELPALWFYAVNWLKIAIPQPTDSHRERWPLHPIWSPIMAAFEDGREFAPLERFSNKRVPRDEYLFHNGLSGIYCFMAKHGITDGEDGVKRYLEAAHKYHRRMGSLHAFLEAKAREKIRKYNTLLNTTALTQKRGKK